MAHEGTEPRPLGYVTRAPHTQNLRKIDILYQFLRFDRFKFRFGGPPAFSPRNFFSYARNIPCSSVKHYKRNRKRSIFFFDQRTQYTPLKLTIKTIVFIRGDIFTNVSTDRSFHHARIIILVAIPLIIFQKPIQVVSSFDEFVFKSFSKSFFQLCKKYRTILDV